MLRVAVSTDTCMPVPGAAQNSPSSKGCGLVVMRSHADAAAAISGLDNYKWEGMHSTMVVKLMPPQRQRAGSGTSVDGAGVTQAAAADGDVPPVVCFSTSFAGITCCRCCGCHRVVCADSDASQACHDYPSLNKGGRAVMGCADPQPACL